MKITKLYTDGSQCSHFLEINIGTAAAEMLVKYSAILFQKYFQ